jgi:hypothetical protein
MVVDMQKQENQQQAVPVRVYIDELQQKRKIAEALEPLHLTEKALVLINGRNVLAIKEKAIGQMERVGRMSLEPYDGNVYELKALGVGRRINGHVCVVDELVIPSKDKLLLMKEGGNLWLSGIKSEMSKEEYNELRPAISRGERVVSPLIKLIDFKADAEKTIKLLKALEDLGKFPIIFADPHMSLDKLMKTNWEIIVVGADSYHLTEHYENRVKRTPGESVFDFHIHLTLERDEPRISAADIFQLAAEDQAVEWFGVMRVRQMKPEEFKFDKNDFSAFFSKIGSVKWARKELRLAEKDWRKDYHLLLALAKEFEEKQMAEALTYSELLKGLG